ncbi:MAG: ShlB/FhaC/HecB family hemolysin secretion/activation protein [Limisphaerales bacterium]
MNVLTLAVFAMTFHGWSQETQTNEAVAAEPMVQTNETSLVEPTTQTNAEQAISTNAAVANEVVQTNETSVVEQTVQANEAPAVDQTTQTNEAAVVEPATQTGEAPAAEQTYLEKLTGIVIVASDADVKHAGAPGIQGLVIKGPPFLQTREFEKLMAKYLGAPLTDASAKEMEIAIIKYCRSIGHSVVDVFFAEQEVVNNTIQLAVMEGKISGMGIRNDGHKWFSDKLIMGNLHLRPGEPILQDTLDSDMSWLNQNRYTSLGNFDGTFREVRAELTPGEALGSVNITNVVVDRFPVRPYVGYDNGGVPVIGKSRFFGGFEWANAFGLDHRLNYQYTGDKNFEKYSSHMASYTIPFSWHHQLTILGTYAEVDPNFALFGPPFNNLHIDNGNLYQISARYSITLDPWHTLKQRITAGFDFKHINTPLFFGTSSTFVLSSNLVDVAQFTLGYQAVLPDRHGNTALSLQAVYSPGGMTDNNNNATYSTSSSGNPNTHAQYFYGQIEFRRETRLPGNFLWLLRGMGQISDSTLYASEVFGVGGFSSARGYDERTATGDDGWLVQNELRTPEFVLGNITGKENAKDWVQGLIFVDAGGVFQLHPVNGQSPDEQLLSVGIGARYQAADNFRFRIDYGYQLKRSYLADPNNLLNQPHGQFDIGLELSY